MNIWMYIICKNESLKIMPGTMNILMHVNLWKLFSSCHQNMFTSDVSVSLLHIKTNLNHEFVQVLKISCSLKTEKRQGVM